MIYQKNRYAAYMSKVTLKIDTKLEPKETSSNLCEKLFCKDFNGGFRLKGGRGGYLPRYLH
jgi:hypothetical protein